MKIPSRISTDRFMSSTKKNTHKFHTFDAVIIALMAAIIAVCSWISIPVGAVPVTLQTFAIAVCGGLLGMKKGTLAVVVYTLLGVVGLPVFSLFTGGIGAISGATGGYILGFVFITVFGGFFCDRFSGNLPLTVIGSIIGLLICYATGTLWYAFVYLGNTGHTGLISVLVTCVLPYIIPDFIKITLGCLVAKTVRKRIGAFK